MMLVRTRCVRCEELTALTTFFRMNKNALYISSGILGNVDKLPVNYREEMSHSVSGI